MASSSQVTSAQASPGAASGAEPATSPSVKILPEVAHQSGQHSPEGILAVDGARLRTSTTTSCVGDPGPGPHSSPILDTATPVSPPAPRVLRP